MTRPLTLGTALSIARLLIVSCFFAGALLGECEEKSSSSSELIVDLRNPVYQDGILYTTQGGVIKGDELRIQARQIEYEKRGQEIHRIAAEGDLMVQFKGRVYVGDRLEFDFKKHTGVVFEGKTFAKMWYLSSSRIELNPDGSYKAREVTITTCENVDSSWDLHAGKVHMLKGDLMSAKKVRFRFFKIPFLWLPSFKVSLKKFKEPVFRYSVRWDKGPRLMARYQLYSWQDFAVYGRLQYRWGKGWGGALETEYLPEGCPTTFVTRSYVATDRLDNANNILKRYRVQGVYQTETQEGRTKVNLSWDKYSDVRMPDDFKSEDFEVNPSKITQLLVRHEAKNWIGSFKVRPRLNPFESIKQDLPTLYGIIRPLSLGSSGVIFSHWMKLSYMDFAYSSQLAPTPGLDPLYDFRSIRLDFRPKFYKTFQIGAATITPEVGGIGIFYSGSPSNQPKTLGLLQYSLRLHARGVQDFERYRHTLEPYIEYKGLSHPTVGPDQHYIFTIQDGLYQINQVRAGVRQTLWSHHRIANEPSFTADLYANAFFGQSVIRPYVYKVYCDLSWRLSSLYVTLNNIWNIENKIWDVLNARIKWTINENAAISFEGRYRSKYDWRKADHENFILDATRSEGELLASPISDQRITLLSKCFFRFTPFWECEIGSHHGFYRLNQTPYNEVNINVFTWISSHWKLRLSYRYTESRPHNHFDMGLNLIRK